MHNFDCTMKLNRSYLYITISSLALVIVLIIQVNWIVQTAKIKEEIFNEKAKMVLSKTTEALSSDTVAYNNLEAGTGRNEVKKIDSLFNFYMRQYNIDFGYYFEVKPVKSSELNTSNTSNVFRPEQPGCYQQCIKDNTTAMGKTNLELKLVIPDAEEFIIEEMGIPFVSSVILILVVLITFWRTTVSLIKEKEIAEHTTDFLNNMTHEFKTPLTNISLAGKMLVKESNIHQTDKIKHYTGIILEENEKLKDQVEQILSMSALERGEIPLQKTELDLHALITDALKCISVQIEAKQGDVKLHLGAEMHRISGDTTHLTNALCNLIDNAIKYAQDKPQIIIQTFNKEQNIVITISDNGIGIEKEYHKLVFEKYFRVPTGDVHDVKGFGLGLAYLKKIIELHGGTIELQSEIGKGTTFTITLPHA